MKRSHNFIALGLVAGVVALVSTQGCLGPDPFTIQAGGSGGTGGMTATSSGSGGSGGSGGTPECATPQDCPGTDTECQTRTCINTVCGIDFTPADTALLGQTPNDCQVEVCNGNGATTVKADDSDLPADSDDCNMGTCTAGVPGQAPKPLGTVCAFAGGKVCGDPTGPNAGMCLECNSNADCTASTPKCDVTNTCVACSEEISAGWDHTCARNANGSIWCWGFGDQGQNGNAMTVAATTPFEVSVLGLDAVEISAGYKFACARKSDGTVWCWGRNSAGQCGDGTTGAAKLTPVQATTLGTTVAEISAGGGHTCARKTDNTVWCWGQNNLGQVGDGTTTLKTTPIQVATNATTVVTRRDTTCVHKSDSTVWCWGLNSSGQVGDGTTTLRTSPVQIVALATDAVEIEVGDAHTCARKADGSVWCWGANNNGQLGDGTTGNKSTPVQVMGLTTGVVDIWMGSYHTCARKADGTVWCWGANGSGQLGDGTTSNKTSPVEVTVLGTDVIELSGSQYHTCARKLDKSVWCWGYNVNGQCGDGAMTSPQLVPVSAAMTCP